MPNSNPVTQRTREVTTSQHFFPGFHGERPAIEGAAGCARVEQTLVSHSMLFVDPARPRRRRAAKAAPTHRRLHLRPRVQDSAEDPSATAAGHGPSEVQNSRGGCHEYPV